MLALGQHDADYVDAYYGPPEWRMEAERQTKSARGNRRAPRSLWRPGGDSPDPSAAELSRLRHQYLTRQLEALRARVAMLQGTKLTFDEESKALYDAVAPTHTKRSSCASWKSSRRGCRGRPAPRAATRRSGSGS